MSRGRGKFCGEVEGDFRTLYREVRKHLASNMPEIDWDDDGKFARINAGFHTVGYIRVIEADVAYSQPAKED